MITVTVTEQGTTRRLSSMKVSGTVEVAQEIAKGAVLSYLPKLVSVDIWQSEWSGPATLVETYQTAVA